jgi:hypothetical protein
MGVGLEYGAKFINLFTSQLQHISQIRCTMRNNCQTSSKRRAFPYGRRFAA